MLFGQIYTPAAALTSASRPGSAKSAPILTPRLHSGVYYNLHICTSVLKELGEPLSVIIYEPWVLSTLTTFEEGSRLIMIANEILLIKLICFRLINWNWKVYVCVYKKHIT